MTTSDESWSGKPRAISSLERPDHYYLGQDSECYFFGEYTTGGGYSCSDTNSLILNLKKNPLLRGTNQWPHKERAIREAAKAIKASLQSSFLGSTCFVPMPPSKSRDHPEYDDRMEQVAAMTGAPDVRSILYSDQSREARHQSSATRDPNELRQLVKVDRSKMSPHPQRVIILDDMLTTGCGFMVAREKLLATWPAAQIIGLFIARRVIPKPDFSDAFDL